jgi:hypothetical protein
MVVHNVVFVLTDYLHPLICFIGTKSRQEELIMVVVGHLIPYKQILITLIGVVSSLHWDNSSL